jgi:RNA polymerase sigma factor (sigma-70 family)
MKRSETLDFGVTSVEDLNPSPSQLLAGDEERQQLMTALRSIALDQQVVLELFYWEELNVQQIAEITDVPVGTVKSRLHAGRQALKNRLGQGFMRIMKPLPEPPS